MISVLYLFNFSIFPSSLGRVLQFWKFRLSWSHNWIQQLSKPVFQHPSFILQSLLLPPLLVEPQFWDHINLSNRLNDLYPYCTYWKSLKKSFLFATNLPECPPESTIQAKKILQFWGGEAVGTYCFSKFFDLEGQLPSKTHQDCHHCH